MDSKVIYIEAVVFDFDGTLTIPGALDFPAIKEALDCPAEMPILEYIESLPAGKHQSEARTLLDRFEMAAAAESRPNQGALQIIEYIKSLGLPLVLLTRNSLRAVERALANFDHLTSADFDLLITRDDPINPKPEPDAIFWIAEKLKIPCERLLVVGDYIFDIEAGRRAGALTVWLQPPQWPADKKPDGDFTISALEQLKAIIRLGRPLPTGKFPNDLLDEHFSAHPLHDPALVIPPRVGEDTAAVDVSGEEIVILKSDPITFATDAIGRYAVVVNANDIATSGATPRWMLTTLLFPPGLSASAMLSTMDDLHRWCRQHSISLCGGHTEITDAVTRPVVTGMMVGTVKRERLIDKRNIKEGDSILVTKTIGIEGTAIIAREFDRRLREAGIAEAQIRKGQKLLEQISILPEARIAAASESTSGMHDVTEGGIVTALMELSQAAGHRLQIDLASIPVLPLTRRFCELLDLDPLGLIGSGCLLICCRAEVCRSIERDLHRAGIASACIGRVGAAGSGIEATRDGQPCSWPQFEVDEIARLF